MTLDAFKKKWGLGWYKMLNSEMGRDFVATMKLNGPQTRQVNLSPRDVLEFGTVITAQNQGWFDALGVIEQQLIVDADGPAELGEADYTEGEEQRPVKNSKRKRK